ncbi:MAG TPA: serine hydrolase domain-containing protein [Holophagaceae bacterium]|nr:serine hydrolase domain-containing protein [Holophagaceae bacterium]
MKSWIVLSALCLSLACGGGSSSDSGSSTPPPDPWAPVTSAIQADQSDFPNGVCVEVMTPDGIVYSQSFGGMTNSSLVAVASASKWVASTTILRLVDEGVFPHGLDTKTSELLVDTGTGQPWTGNMGNITLRDLLSFTSGIQGDDPNADVQTPLTFSLAQAVQAIYTDDAAAAAAPNSYFDYGNAHLRIAARMSEVATGKSWDQIFTEQVHDPMGWAASSTFDTLHPACQNPDPAGDLSCTGLDYMRFVAMELRGGQDNGSAFLQRTTWTEQRTDGYGPATTISGSPYKSWFNWTIHYALGNWIGTADGKPESATNPPIWYGSTGSFGWCPWVTADGAYGAIIETRQSDQGKGVLSENLKAQLDPLIRAALAQHPPVIRSVP